MGEMDAFLRCGILAHGFARVWRESCGKDDVVAEGWELTLRARECADRRLRVG